MKRKHNHHPVASIFAVSWATSTSFAIANDKIGVAGDYSVLVTNLSTSAMSSNATPNELP